VSAPTIISVVPSSPTVSITLQSPNSTDDNLFYVALLFTDLTTPLDEAATTSDGKRGRTVCEIVNAKVQNGQPIVLSLDTTALNERFYVAVCAYRCNWNAADADGKLLRSGRKLWNNNGVPQTVSTATIATAENLFAKGYKLSETEGILYIRARVPASVTTPDQYTLTCLNNDVDPAVTVWKYDFSSASAHGSKHLKGTSLSSVITTATANSSTPYDTVVIGQDGIHHIFILTDLNARQLVLKQDVQAIKTSYKVKEDQEQLDFLAGIGGYAYLPINIDDPVMPGITGTFPGNQSPI
jgi:hypothetical protein